MRFESGPGGRPLKSGLPVGHEYGRESYIGVDVVDVVTVQICRMVWYGEEVQEDG